MSNLPILKAKDIVLVILRLGFRAIRQRGSHQFFKHPDGRITLIPRHPGEDIGKDLFHEILNQIKLHREEFLKLLKKR